MIDNLMPPADLLRIGGNTPERFRQTGARWLPMVTERCRLRPDASLLDVGCGAGRIAIPLTAYLWPHGRYEGLDVVAPAIAWCTSNITPRYPNFRFQVADVYSGLFNPTGTTTGADYTIPFDDATFDVVCLLFVFSHMLPNAVERYLSEIARVLKPAGRSLATYVLLNQDSLALVEKTAGRRRDPHGNPGRALLGHDCGEYRLSNPRRPEALVAHREEFVLRLHERFGLEVDELGYGAWPGRDGESVTTHHDFIVAIKRAAG